MNSHKTRLIKLRSVMKAQGIDTYIIPSGDEFMNEYVPFYARRLEWLTGFTGSAGMVIILKDKAAFFTDGRYTLQAATQLPKGAYEILNTADVKPVEWLAQNLKNGVLGVSHMLFTKDAVKRFENVAKILLCDDLVDLIWHDKPQKPVSQIIIHPVKYAGQKHSDKIKAVTSEIKHHGADGLLLTAPESVCWLLNIRGGDVPNTPLVLARFFLEKKGVGVLFVDLPPSHKERELAHHLGTKIKIQPLSALTKYLQKISGKKILLDKNTSPYLFHNLLEKKNTIIEISDPCILPKACKNNIEVQGAIDAHMQDGVAVTEFLYWLQANYKKKNITEIYAAEKLMEFRRKNPDFIEPSFDTIAGFGSNGAIVHYHASESSSKKIGGNGIFLLDSGGQYPGGTTDITRTISIGKPTKEQMRNFTLVLKGHVALATAVFPAGTSGHQLDSLARQYLWQHGLDYDHGTGHGVGSFLGVHEGPQRISKAPNEVALMPGMIISNEPGYYKNGEYGIRIESLVVVEPAPKNKSKVGDKNFLQFRTLTCAPIDATLVDFAILNVAEKEWLHDYHVYISKILTPKLDKKAALWLKGLVSAYRAMV